MGGIFQGGGRKGDSGKLDRLLNMLNQVALLYVSLQT